VEGEDENVDQELIERVRQLGEIKVTLHRKKLLYDNIVHPADRYRHRRGEQVDYRRERKRRYRAQPENRLSRLESLEDIPEKALKGRAMSLRAAYVNSSMARLISRLDFHDYSTV
jgi:hypothetical protein